MKKGFTLMELIIVVIIIGILATLGFTQYTKFAEKGREAEAKSVLGSIRTAATAIKMEQETWPTLADLALGIPETGACNTKYFFGYAVDTAKGTATASRCTAGGKTPQVKAADAYTVTIDFDAGTLVSTLK